MLCDVGFARNLDWELTASTGGAAPSIEMTLVDTEATRAMWPTKFKARGRLPSVCLHNLHNQAPVLSRKVRAVLLLQHTIMPMDFASLTHNVSRTWACFPSGDSDHHHGHRQAHRHPHGAQHRHQAVRVHLLVPHLLLGQVPPGRRRRGPRRPQGARPPSAPEERQ